MLRGHRSEAAKCEAGQVEGRRLVRRRRGEEAASRRRDKDTEGLTVYLEDRGKELGIIFPLSRQARLISRSSSSLSLGLQEAEFEPPQASSL